MDETRRRDVRDRAHAMADTCADVQGGWGRKPLMAFAGALSLLGLVACGSDSGPAGTGAGGTTGRGGAGGSSTGGSSAGHGGSGAGTAGSTGGSSATGKGGNNTGEGGAGARGRCRLLVQLLLQRFEILKQPGAGEAQEVEAEGRVLHVELLDLAVADAQDEPGFDAFQRLGSHV